MKRVSFLIGSITIMISQPALSYIDPGVGSMLLQGFIAAVATGMVTVSIYWQKVKSFFKRKKTDKKIEDNKKESTNNQRSD
ncbi:hypothetical protein AB4587_07275 [Vibrio breoganii]